MSERMKSKWGAWETTFDADNLLGEVVAWDTRGLVVPQAQVAQALTDAGLDPKLCRSIPPPKALRRAVSQLRRTKVVGEVEDTEERLVFQFSRTSKQTLTAGQLPWATLAGDSLSYEGEGRVVLDKETGDLDGDNRELVQLVSQLLDEATVTRKTSDVTSIAHRVFKAHADLFAIRQAGGCYFVPARHAGVVDAVAKFLSGCGAQMRRYPVAKGHLTGDNSVRDAIRDGIQGMIDDHLKAVASFGPETRDKTMSKELDAIKLTRFKIDAYLEYLGEETEALRQEVVKADEAWRTKVEAILEERDELTANEQITNGQVSGPFASAEELIGELNEEVPA